MKLQFDQIVEHWDADLVLRTLEQHLREVSLETVRTEDELIVYGLGPSFRTMNRNDKTIVRATSQPDATTLHTEANFLASALAGDVAQDEIVRSKIERAFESLKTELSNGRASRPIAARATPTAAPVLPSPRPEALPTIPKGSAPATIEVEENSRTPIGHTSDGPQKAFIEAKPAPQPEAKPEPQPNLKVEAKREPQPKPTPKIDAPVLTTPRRSAPVPAALTMEAVPIKKGRSAILLVLPLLLLVLAAAFHLLQHRRASQSLFAAEPEGHIASISQENKAAAPAPAPPATAVTPPQPLPAAMPTDIKAWVQAWAAAMSGRDIQTQLSFYAVTLDRYFLASNVNRERLLKDKQAEIDDRKGTWTLKAEDVVVEKQTPTKAVVYLNKHIIVQLPSSAIREERIKGQLKLKMVDGVWKITSERTIG